MNEPTSHLPPPPAAPGPRRVRRSRADRKLGGVAGGIAEYFDLDPSLVRLGFVAFALLGGSGILFYAIAWLVIPAEAEIVATPPTVAPPAPAAEEPPAGDRPDLHDIHPFTVFPMV